MPDTVAFPRWPPLTSRVLHESKIETRFNISENSVNLLSRQEGSRNVYRLCQKKLYNFPFLITEKVNKAQQQHCGGQNLSFMCLRRFLNGTIPWSGVKVMVP